MLNHFNVIINKVLDADNDSIYYTTFAPEILIP